MYKVLHSVLSLEVGGLENGVVNLVNNTPTDMQVDVLCLRARGSLASRVTFDRSRVLLAPHLDNHSIGAGIKAHLKVLKENQYDIVHTHGWSTMLTGALASWVYRMKSRRSRPLVINGEHGVFYDKSFKKRFLQKCLFERMDGNLSVSADLGLRMEAAFSLKPHTFTTLLNGVDTTLFKPNESIRAQYRLEFGFSPTDLVIGTVGRLVAIKNYPMLIRTFHQLVQRYPHIRLVLCGDGKERQFLETLVQELGLKKVVHFTGQIDNVAHAMQAFDIFALTSDMEGLPNTLLEAMATGIAPVVTDVGGSREVMPVDGGLLVEPKNQQKFLLALQRLIADEPLRKQFGVKSREHVRSYLSLQAMAEKYYAYYRQLIAVSSQK